MNPSNQNRPQNESLSLEDLRWLAVYGRDDQSQRAPEAVLAKLQQLGLLMRGWGRTYVVTFRGREVLHQATKISAAA